MNGTNFPVRRHIAVAVTAALMGTAFGIADAGTVRSFDSYAATELDRNDDLYTDAVPIGFEVNFFGEHYDQTFVNNNGNITFDAPLGTYTPFDLTTTSRAIIAPFFADVDTRDADSGIVNYGRTMVAGRQAFVANYPDVGYYNQRSDRLNDFQVLLVDRSDSGLGNFDIELNYDRIEWETGDASGGTDGLGGASARAGYANGTQEPGTFFEIEGSGVNGALLDDNTATGLIHTSNIGVPGRWLFLVRDGRILDLPAFEGYGSLAATSNQQAVADAMDRGYPDHMGDMERVFRSLLFATDAEAQHAFDDLSGEVHTAAPVVALRAERQFVSAVAGASGTQTVMSADLYSEPQPSGQDAAATSRNAGGKGRGLWIDPYGMNGSIDGDASFSGIDYDGWGLAGGFDMEVKPDLRLGAALGYGSWNADLDRPGNNNTDATAIHGALYADWARGPWQALGLLGYSRHDVDAKRSLTIETVSDSLSDQLKASYDIALLSGHAELRYAHRWPAKGLAVEPFVGLTYSQANQDDFTEENAETGTNLRVKGDTTTSTRSTLGAALRGELQGGNGWIVRPAAQAGWVHEFGDTAGTIGASFATAPGAGAFNIEGVGTDEDALLAGVGLSASRDDLALSIGYTGYFGSTETMHTLRAGLNYRF